MKTSSVLLAITACLIFSTGCMLVYPKVTESAPELVGVVKDSATEEPISNALVTRSGAAFSYTHTDDKGRFKLTKRMAPQLVVANPANTYEFPNYAGEEIGTIKITHDDYVSLELSELREDHGFRFSDSNMQETVYLTPKKLGEHAWHGKQH